MSAIRDAFVSTDRGSIFARLHGPNASPEHPALVLFHDSLGCVDLWRDFPQRLVEATGSPVLAYDRLGFGRSDPAEGCPPLNFMAVEARDALPRLLDTFRIERFAVLGHSVGGAMAIHAAGAHPDRCISAITIAAQTFVEDCTFSGIRAAQQEFTDPDRRARLSRYHGDKADWVLAAWFDRWLDPAFADWSLDAALAKVRCPVLAIHGERDEYGSQTHPRRIVEHAGGSAEMLLLAECGHVPQRERPDVVCKSVTDALSKALQSE